MPEGILPPIGLQFKSSELYRSRFKRQTGSVERVINNGRGEVNEVRALPGCEGVGVQIDSVAIDTAGPKEIANEFEMKEM